MRGILGGLFDPVHFGHYRPALELMPILGLAKILLIPCGIPAHRAPPQAAAKHRWNMVRLVADGVKLVADDRELRNSELSYTYSTLASLKEEGSEPLCLLVGMDALHGLPLWHRAEDLIRLCHVAAIARPGNQAESLLPAAWRSRCTRDPKDLQTTPCGRIYLHYGTLYDFSSTRIRALIRAGMSPQHCMPNSVWTYIRRHRLYFDPVKSR